jgi:hypothetical protein
MARHRLSGLLHLNSGYVMTKEIRLNAFLMNCVGHLAPGQWTNPEDTSSDYLNALGRKLDRTALPADGYGSNFVALIRCRVYDLFYCRLNKGRNNTSA